MDQNVITQPLPADTSWLITTDGLRIINGRRVYMTAEQRERFNALVCELDRMMDDMERAALALGGKQA